MSIELNLPPVNPPSLLRRRRHDKGWSLEQAARALSIVAKSRGWRQPMLDEGELSRVERGTRLPTTKQLKGLSLLFDLTVDAILTDLDAIRAANESRSNG